MTLTRKAVKGVTAATHAVDGDLKASGAFLETTDGGKVWSAHAAPRSLALAEGLSCANGSDCWAVGLADNRVDAAVARTTDGGRVWTPESVPALQTAMSSTSSGPMTYTLGSRGSPAAALGPTYREPNNNRTNPKPNNPAAK